MIPKPGVSSTEQEPEVIFIQTNEEEEVFPVSDSGKTQVRNGPKAGLALSGYIVRCQTSKSGMARTGQL